MTDRTNDVTEEPAKAPPARATDPQKPGEPLRPGPQGEAGTTGPAGGRTPGRGDEGGTPPPRVAPDDRGRAKGGRGEL
jgi:hypothetical protein